MLIKTSRWTFRTVSSRSPGPRNEQFVACSAVQFAVPQNLALLARRSKGARARRTRSVLVYLAASRHLSIRVLKSLDVIQVSGYFVIVLTSVMYVVFIIMRRVFIRVGGALQVSLCFLGTGGGDAQQSKWMLCRISVCLSICRHVHILMFFSVFFYLSLFSPHLFLSLSFSPYIYTHTSPHTHI